MNDIIRDFDKLILDKRIATLAGKSFDVSLVPTRLALKYVVFRDKALIMTGETAFKQMVSIVAEICGKPIVNGNIFKKLFNKSINEKWLINHSNFEQLQAFMDFVIEPLMAKEEDIKDSKEKKK
ncbi:MAG: hypothetical protein A2163_11595 [Actinobacteria bacterium RBG_13_35_12]|nr:MAG: hypothetical protein A2163_11595 [Actinobacteria bacterium RBG_13_35_12]